METKVHTLERGVMNPTEHSRLHENVGASSPQSGDLSAC